MSGYDDHQTEEEYVAAQKDRWKTRRDAAIKGLDRLKTDFGMVGANATTVERAIQALRTAPVAAASLVGGGQ